VLVLLVLAQALSIEPANAAELGRLDQHPGLRTIKLKCLEDLKELPEALRRQTKLRELSIDNGNGCVMNPVLPEWLGELSALEKLELYGAQDPGEGGGKPRSLPASLKQLKRLTVLNLGRNDYGELPEVVKELKQLRELRFDYNALKDLPAFVAQLKELRVLSLAANDLADVPKELEALPHLKELDLSSNCPIAKNPKKKAELKKRFPKVKLNLSPDECAE
jgi:Leucine-rich repeat (LRR) protein